MGGGGGLWVKHTASGGSRQVVVPFLREARRGWPRGRAEHVQIVRSGEGRGYTGCELSP